MNEFEILREYKGFNTDYFKIGQLIKVTARNHTGVLMEEDYGFIKYVSCNKIVFTYAETDGEQKERSIIPTDLLQENINIKIEVIAESAVRMGC